MNIPPPREHLTTLYEITRQLNSSLDLDTILDYVMDKVIEVTGAERGFLMLRNAESGNLDFTVAKGINQKDLEKPKFMISRTIVEKTAESGEAVLTDNAQQSFSKEESVVMLALRSILCVPISVRREVIGIVYVDNRTHIGVFDESHLELMTAFASQAGIAIENARLYQIAIEQGRMQRELEMAHSIQKSLLPTEFPVLEGYEVAVFWASAREVAGDFYDCFMLNNSMGVIIADVADKGAPAAIFMAMARSFLRGTAIGSPSAEATIQTANELILNDAGVSGMFVTTYYTIFYPNGKAECVNAGHNLPLLRRAKDGSLEWLPKGGLPLGWFDEIPLKTLNYQLEKGDVLVFYTDGLTEAEDTLKNAYGEKRLEEVIRNVTAEMTAQDIMDSINASVNKFVGDAAPFDDRTIVVVRYLGEE